VVCLLPPSLSHLLSSSPPSNNTHKPFIDDIDDETQYNYQFFGVDESDARINLLLEELEPKDDERIIYMDGSHYKGCLIDELRHGHGVCVFAGVGKYSGHWEYDKRSGYGVMRWKDGGIYDGIWDEDLEDGVGTMKYPNGDVYIGQWNHGLKHGKGLFTFNVNRKNKNVPMHEYDGDWVNDKQEGFGKVTWSNGSIEETHWENGKRKRS